MCNSTKRWSIWLGGTEAHTGVEAGVEDGKALGQEMDLSAISHRGRDLGGYLEVEEHVGEFTEHQDGQYGVEDG